MVKIITHYLTKVLHRSAAAGKNLFVIGETELLNTKEVFDRSSEKFVLLTPTNALMSLTSQISIRNKIDA